VALCTAYLYGPLRLNNIPVQHVILAVNASLFTVSHAFRHKQAYHTGTHCLFVTKQREANEGVTFNRTQSRNELNDDRANQSALKTEQVFGRKKNGMGNNEELPDCYTSPSILRIVATMGEKECKQNFDVETY
jgi:hypothetical protein